MPKKAHRKELRGSDLVQQPLKKFSARQNVHKHDDELVGKKQGKLGG